MSRMTTIRSELGTSKGQELADAPVEAPADTPINDPIVPGRASKRTDSAEASPAPESGPRGVGSVIRSVGLWFDNSSKRYTPEEIESITQYEVDWVRLIPFLGVHLMCLFAFWTGWSGIAVGVAAGMYVFHMFVVTAFYHRYFSHRTFKTSRVAQFIFAVAGCSCVQRGPIWWAARHRHHHRHSDEEDDVHSPIQHGFYWSHFGWITSKCAFDFDEKAVPDLMKFPELRFLNRFDNLIPILEGVAVFYLGVFLEARGWNTNGFQMLIWGFFISIVASSHATFTINSLTHMWGRKRYKSKDESRNSLLLAIITGGEGWHNNHHYYPGATRQGFYWWELDMTYYGLWIMSKLGIIWNLNEVPEKVRESHHLNSKSTNSTS